MQYIQVQELSENIDIKSFLNSYIQDGIFHATIVFNSSFENAKTLRDTVDTICAMMGLDSKWKTRIVLIVDELNNNAIEYGSKHEDENRLEIYMKKGADELEIKISVQDTGTGKQAKTAKEMEELREGKKGDSPEAHKSIRGRGLFMIISNLVDTLYFRDSEHQGLIVGIEKKLPIQ